MSNDIDLIYWDGHSINAMTRDQLQNALADAIMQIENLKLREERKFKSIFALQNLIRKMEGQNEIYHSRFANPDYIASFC